MYNLLTVVSADSLFGLISEMFDTPFLGVS